MLLSESILSEPGKADRVFNIYSLEDLDAEQNEEFFKKHQASFNLEDNKKHSGNLNK